MIVATAEADKESEIHIWSMIDCNLIKKFKSSHRLGVTQLQFSFEGSYLFSIGIDKQFTIQVTEWKQARLIAFSNITASPILGLAVDPYDKNRFSICGKLFVQSFTTSGLGLQTEELVTLSSEESEGGKYITSLAYIYYLLGDSVVTDLIVGNSKGDISLVTNGSFIPLKEKAHDGMINCLKITDVLHKKIVIITAGEDEMIKFWDTTFQHISTFSIRKHNSFLDNDGDGPLCNLSAQSLDIYTCQPPPKLKTDDGLTTGFDFDNVRILYKKSLNC